MELYKKYPVTETNINGFAHKKATVDDVRTWAKEKGLAVVSIEDAKDITRYKYIRDNQSWHRYGTLLDPDSYAFVGCKFPYLAKFDCAVMLDYNIDKMIESGDKK